MVSGQISASLTSFSRTIDEYADLAKKELIQSKQEKAYERVKGFRSELSDYKERFASLKKQREDTVSAARPTMQRSHPEVALCPDSYANGSDYSQPSKIVLNCLGDGLITQRLRRTPTHNQILLKTRHLPPRQGRHRVSLLVPRHKMLQESPKRFANRVSSSLQMLH